jgi:uncharacterized RDD family membrane protein YckC
MKKRICEGCGESLTENFRKCPNCGRAQAASSPDHAKTITDNNKPSASNVTQYVDPANLDIRKNNQDPVLANFFERTLACLIDWIIVFSVALVPLIIFSTSNQIKIKGMTLTLLGDISLYTIIAIYLGYPAMLHSSKRQATFGKRFFGLKLSLENGGEITFGKAMERAIVTTLANSILSFLSVLLFIGVFYNRDQNLGGDEVYLSIFFILFFCFLPFSIALFNEKKKTLYDYICKTIVIKASSTK